MPISRASPLDLFEQPAKRSFSSLFSAFPEFRQELEGILTGIQKRLIFLIAGRASG
jgi:hypothetical protein